MSILERILDAFCDEVAERVVEKQKGANQPAAPTRARRPRKPKDEPAKPAKGAEEPPAQPETPAEPPPAPTADSVREALRNHVQVHGRDAAVAVLKAHGANAVSELPEEKYPAVLEALAG